MLHASMTAHKKETVHNMLHTPTFQQNIQAYLLLGSYIIEVELYFYSVELEQYQ